MFFSKKDSSCGEKLLLARYNLINSLGLGKFLEWVPFEEFQNVTYITSGGFGKIYLAKWHNGPILEWDIENKKWKRWVDARVVLKSLDNSSDISTDFLNEVSIIKV